MFGSECLTVVQLSTSRENPRAYGVSQQAQALLEGGRMTSLCAWREGQQGFGAAGVWHLLAGSKSGELSAVRMTVPASPDDDLCQVCSAGDNGMETTTLCVPEQGLLYMLHTERCWRRRLGCA
jgi:hypothetical protein